MKFLGVPWGLRPRRTEQKLARTLLSMLPSAHLYRVGVRVVSFRGSMATPPILYLRFAGSLAVAAQDSRPSGSLLLSCKALSSSTSCRLFRKHLPADCVGRGGLGTQPDLHRETETPKASQVMVSTTFPPPAGLPTRSPAVLLVKPVPQSLQTRDSCVKAPRFTAGLLVGS